MSAGGVKIRLVDRVLNAVNSKRSVNFDVPKTRCQLKVMAFTASKARARLTWPLRAK